MIKPELVLWEVLCSALLYSVFCRLVRTSKTTRITVRVGIWLLGVSSLVGIGAPFYGWLPDNVVITITAASLIMELVTMSHWRHGVPSIFVHHKGGPD
jgi:hypothetical protein